MRTNHCAFSCAFIIEPIEYCSKEGNFVEFGERPKAGRRGKFADAVDMIVAGDSIEEVANENPEAYARGGRGLRELQYVFYLKHV